MMADTWVKRGEFMKRTGLSSSKAYILRKLKIVKAKPYGKHWVYSLEDGLKYQNVDTAFNGVIAWIRWYYNDDLPKSIPGFVREKCIKTVCASEGTFRKAVAAARRITGTGFQNRGRQ